MEKGLIVGMNTIFNFDQILLQNSLRDNKAWIVVLLACVIYRACVDR